MVLSILLSIVFSSAGLLSSAHAYLPNAKMPVCMDEAAEMKTDNARILRFKRESKNQYMARSFVEGIVLDVGGPRNGHDRFAISIGSGENDTLEIVYNRSFGKMPSIQVGDPVAVCGDYITSKAHSGRYPPSPEGAIIHWAHYNPANRSGSLNHKHGFIMFGSNLVGFDQASPGAWDGTVSRSPRPSVENGSPNPSDVGQPAAGKQNGNSGRSKVQTSQRPSGRSTQRPQQTRWKPCRSLQECSARNGS